ncbi:MAG TPA: FkbM family methyltransferase [Microbacteriaceae bacterium]|nr:FkbM family methyltransferase [Microbacteriaceae bacterium]
MLIAPQLLKRIWGIDPRVIVHIGAHEAEELGDYRDLGWGDAATVWVDALPEKAAEVRAKTRDLPNHEVVNAVLWDRAGETIEFKETNNTQASSALDLKDSKELYPDIEVTRVRSFVTQRADEALRLERFERIDLVNLDVQGAELHVLRGFGAQLDKVRAIYSEVNVREIYSGGARFADLDAMLVARGFVLVDSYLLWRVGWGDALWMRAEDVPADASGRRRRRRVSALPAQAKYFVWWLLKGRRKH